MTRIQAFIAAALATLVLAGCTAKEIIVATPANLDVEIKSVTGTKAVVQVTAGNPDACYVYFTMSDGHTDFGLPEKDAARNHLDYLAELYDELDAPVGSFADFAGYRGSREFRLILLSPGCHHKLLLFQIHPKTREIIGDVRTVPFDTPEVKMTGLDFTFTLEGTTLVITPSDPDRTYFWTGDRQSRIEDNFSTPYFYLYDVIDMFERYGFAESMLTRGTVRYEIPVESLWEREIYCIVAVAYDHGEITGYDNTFFFTLRGDIPIPVEYHGNGRAGDMEGDRP